MSKLLRRLCLAAGLLALAPSAHAEERERLEGKAAAKALLGFEHSGVRRADGAVWKECIEPEGRTAYWVDGVYRDGRVEVSPEGEACFTYAEDGYRYRHCFYLERANGALRIIESDGGGAVYLVQRSVPVRSCTGGAQS